MSLVPKVESVVCAVQSVRIGINNFGGTKTYAFGPGSDQRAERDGAGDAAAHDGLDRDEREVLSEDRLVDVVHDGTLPTKALLRGPEQGRVDGDANGRCNDAEPRVEVRARDLREAGRVERERRAPGARGRRADLELVLDDEVLEEEPQEARIGPRVVDRRELEKDERRVEHREPHRRDGVSEEREQPRDEIRERVAERGASAS